MKHYVIPTKKEEPNIIILHAGTNNLKDNQSTTSLANNIIELGISLCTPQNDVMISGICHRTDVSDKNVCDVNNHLKKLCREKKMFFIANDNIHKDIHLNKSGLHLNATGNSVLASNFVGILKC